MKILLRIALFTVCLCVLVAGAVAWLVYEDYHRSIATPLPIGESGYSLLVNPGDNLSTISDSLMSDGLLVHPWYLRYLARRSDVARNLKAGEYLVEPGTNIQALLRQLGEGQVVQRSFTIIEGWRTDELLGALQKLPYLEWDLEGQDAQALSALIEDAGLHPEGQFLPETYFYTRGTKASQILRRAHDALQETLEKAWANRADDLPLQSPYEALILASIIEKETGLASEREQISGVFIRRLKIGMRLQTDPTVIYGLGGRFDGNLRKVDLQTPGPYNTYVNTGLPPTPIALAGTAAIQAALHPAPGDALYFVARGDGSHEFSANLKAHNAAVHKYQIQARRQ